MATSDQIKASIDNITPADLSGVESKLDAIKNSIDSIENLDLSNIESRLVSINNSIGLLDTADVSGVVNSLDELLKAMNFANSMLQLLVANSARNAKANDLNWQLKCNSTQLEMIQNQQNETESNSETIIPIS